MPLNKDGLDLVRANLQLLSLGGRPKMVSIGYLTEEQHAGINAIRVKEGKPLLEQPEILFMGRHFYESRSKDGYTVEDMVAMVESALSVESIAHAHHKMTGLMNHSSRGDSYGNRVHDLGVLELYARRPKAELFSVIPKGDRIKPNDVQK